MPYEIRTPFARGPARQTAPGTWRKRLLPVGEIDYKGRRLSFNKPYLDGLATAYNAKAYDQVPFQLAKDQNEHTNDPERFRGEILGMDVQSDGLWVTVKPTARGHQLLTENPNLGVSARIVEDYARADGQHYDAAIQHVLGTLDPRIPQLGAWEQVNLSNSHAEVVIDLSEASYASDQEGGITMPDLNADQSARLAQLLELDPARLNALLQSAPPAPPAPAPAVPAADGADMTDDDLAALIDGMSDDEFATLADEFGLNESEPEPVGAGAGLSNTGYGLSEIDLANARLAENERQLGVLQARADRETYENEKRTLAGKFNVPPFITELARPLLEGTGHTVELSNGQHTDAGLIVRRVLQEFGKVTAGLGLDAPVELGSAMDEPAGGSNGNEVQSIVDRYRQQTGI
jgi:hypothetical protein